MLNAIVTALIDAVRLATFQPKGNGFTQPNFPMLPQDRPRP